MTSVIKLSVSYDGYYGGSVNSYCLLPVAWNGLYTDRLEQGFYEREVYLGEIEGKHSEVYGDLEVEIIDFSSMSIKEINELINNSTTENLYIFFEGKEEEFDYSLEELNEEELSESIEMRSRLEKDYNLQFKDWSIKSELISDKFIEHLQRIYQEDYITFTIKKSDEVKTVNLLNSNGIEIYQ